MAFPTADREAWIRGDYGMLTRSRASSYLRRVLPTKAETRRKRRATHRFFGEAYVAATIEHAAGYYSSAKWLTNPSFLLRPAEEGEALNDRMELHKALWEHFGEAQLSELHSRAARMTEATGEKPGPPDLWLMDDAGDHHFVEVKLPRDSLRNCQLSGLAVIAASLRSRKGQPVTVEVIHLHPKSLETGEVELFQQFLKQVG
jgi:hypothetical protein